jgi:hypothetical protein
MIRDCLKWRFRVPLAHASAMVASGVPDAL